MQSPEEMIATFGRRVRVVRLWSGLSEAEMARTVGVSVRTLKRREAGALGSRGMTRLMMALAETFDVSTDWLLGLDISDAHRDETRPLASAGRSLRRPVNGLRPTGGP